MVWLGFLAGLVLLFGLSIWFLVQAMRQVTKTEASPYPAYSADNSRLPAESHPSH